MKSSKYAGLKSLPTPHALTLPRLLVTTLWAVCGGLLWLDLRKPWGQPGFYVFSLFGFISGLILTRAFLKGRLQLFFPLPLCRQGKCYRLGQDYVWRLGTLFGYETKGIYLYRCRCGDTYIREGRRFMQLLTNDTLHPSEKTSRFSQMGRRLERLMLFVPGPAPFEFKGADLDSPSPK